MNKILAKLLVSINLVLLTACSVPYTPKHIKELQNAKIPDITLELNTGGHTGPITDSAITHDGREIITASEDKTIRVWDTNTGKEKRKILGEIGHGELGFISTIALSSDDRYLAVGGFMPTKAGFLRIYDYKSGHLLKVLDKNEGLTILDISFSNDGKYLVSSNQNGIEYIWNVSKKFEFYDSFKTTYPQFAIKFIKKNSHYFVVSTGSDATLILYDLQSKKIVKTVHTANAAHFMYLATTDANGGNIALSNYITQPSNIYKRVKIFDFNLNPIKTINLSYNKSKINNTTSYIPSALKYSKNGKLLLVGSYVGKNNRNPVVVYRVDKDYTEEVCFKKHTNTIHNVNFINNTTALSIGGSNNEIYIWNVENTKIKKLIRGNGRSVYRAAIKGHNIAWGNIPLSQKYNGDVPKIEYSLNLQSYQINKKTKYFKLLSKTQNEYKLRTYIRNRFAPRSYDKRLVIEKKGKWFKNIDRDETSGYVHTTYGWYKHYIVSGGYNGALYIYNINGDIVATLAGHKGIIYSIDIDGDRLISGSSDQTMKIWDLSRVGKDKIINPLISIFIGNDKSWTMWTPEGYFTQSSNSVKNIYFHLNHGPFKEATVVGINQLYDYFFRPDLVKLKLQGEDISKYTHGLTYKDVLKDPPPSVSIAKVNKKDIDRKKRSVKLSFNVTQNNNGGIGIIRIYQEGKLVKTIGEGKISRTLANADTKAEDFKVNKLMESKQEEYLAMNEANFKSVSGDFSIKDSVGEIKTTSGMNSEGTYNIKLPLQSGKNSISIEAYNKTNTVTSYREHIVVNAKIRKRAPKIYAIVVGVNEFEQSNVQRLKFSEHDASAMAREIKNATRYKTEVTLLKGKQVSKKNILKAIKKIKKKAHLEDKIIFYISTHGKAYKGNLYLVPYNNKNAKEWINFSKLFKEIQSIPSLSQIFIIDACESGSASDTLSAVYDAKASVLAKQSGAHLLMATTSGTSAFEDNKSKHSVFTSNILKALESRKTDKNRNGKISIIELSKTLKEKKYTNAHQFPVIRNIGEDTYIKKVK